MAKRRKAKRDQLTPEFLADVEELFGSLRSRQGRRNAGRVFRAIPGDRPAVRRR